MHPRPLVRRSSCRNTSGPSHRRCDGPEVVRSRVRPRFRWYPARPTRSQTASRSPFRFLPFDLSSGRQACMPNVSGRLSGGEVDPTGAGPRRIATAPDMRADLRAHRHLAEPIPDLGRLSPPPRRECRRSRCPARAHDSAVKCALGGSTPRSGPHGAGARASNEDHDAAIRAVGTMVCETRPCPSPRIEGA